MKIYTFDLFKEFFLDENGLTVVEYVIGAGLLVLALTAIFTSYGTVLPAKLEEIVNGI